MFSFFKFYQCNEHVTSVLLPGCTKSTFEAKDVNNSDFRWQSALIVGKAWRMADKDFSDGITKNEGKTYSCVFSNYT